MDKEVTIHFGSNITSFKDWFPDICTTMADDYGSGYGNVFMFDGAQKWTIHNMPIGNYTASDYYYIMRSESEYAQLKCYNCSFINVENDGSNFNLFDTFGSLHFEDSVFSGIKTVSTPMIRATHSDYETGVNREFSMIQCSFTDIQSLLALFFLDLSLNDVTYLFTECAQ